MRCVGVAPIEIRTHTQKQAMLTRHPPFDKHLNENRML